MNASWKVWVHIPLYGMHAGRCTASRQIRHRRMGAISSHAHRAVNIYLPYAAETLYTGHNGNRYCCSCCRECCSDSASPRLHCRHYPNSRRAESQPVRERSHAASHTTMPPVSRIIMSALPKRYCCMRSYACFSSAGPQLSAPAHSPARLPAHIV